MFSFGDVVWVPFPFVQAPRIRDRPAVVVAEFAPAAGVHLLWVLMITSAANAGWRGDLSLETAYKECGLEVPCVIRTAKIAAIDAGRARRSGALTAQMQARLRANLKAVLTR
jgi:mRNA interferase MazF